MTREQWYRLLSYLLLAVGTVLVFLGMRVLLDSYFGQGAGERAFRSAASHAVIPASLATRLPAKGDTVAKLSFPRLGAQLYVFEGDDEQELRRGPGHLADSAMPGRHGNCVIAGHRDTLFRVLKDIRKNDDILVQTDRGQFLYRVSRTEVVSPSDTRALKPTTGGVLNLITCYPFYYVGSAPKRFIVEARLAGEVSRDVSPESKISKIRNAR
jgi:sortase A